MDDVYRYSSTYQFEGDEEHIVDNEGPLAAVAVGGNAKDDGAHRAEHEDKRNTPCNVRRGLVERRGQVCGGERHGEEVKGIPGLYVCSRRDSLVNHSHLNSQKYGMGECVPMPKRQQRRRPSDDG